ncbi:hypothetical protein K503DRAFT_796887 [Rhizopogon vinicolor AM-OR11-026]|uniref:Heterokaryon incompatibility domain-containing protein n=1 Tax=Rhizopogon vinicolor AM-OR11-026 TaxID=1314800 RepID=A0A1B7ND19_9AGAM|nr:hypothetical protein K503DRAFT_796887 [Rhizopogon vinicolor AM-OR11-026]
MAFPVARIQQIRAVTPCRKLEGHIGVISGVVHLPGGQRIMTCSYDGSLRLWNLESGVHIGEDWQDGESAVIAIALSPDGKRVVSGSGDGALRLWDIDTGRVTTKWTGHAGSVKSLCWNRDGGRIVSGSFDGTARVWDVESGEIILGPIQAGYDVNAVIYSPDNAMIATGVVTFPEKAYVKIWDSKTGKLVTNLREHHYTVTCLAWTPDGSMLISGSLGHSIRTWNTTTWQQITVLTHSSILAISISPNDHILASVSFDGTAQLWNLENGKPIGLPLQHANSVSCVSFSADGNGLATGCLDKNAYLWDISVIVREAQVGFNNLPLSPDDSDKSKLPKADIRRVDQRLENSGRVPPGSVDHPRSSGRQSPSAYRRHAPRRTLLDWVSSLFRHIHTKDSILGSTPSSSQTEEISTSNNDASSPLCSTCSALDLKAILRDGVSQERALPLGHLTDILNKHDQCGLCRLVAIVFRRSWNLDTKPDINIAGITCALYAEWIAALDTEECAALHIPSNVLPARRDLCHRLRIDTSSRPNEVTAAIIAARSSILPEIQLLEEDASKVGKAKELHGRRVGQTVDIGLLKRCVKASIGRIRMAIVPAPRSCRFVALSYLWGGTGEDYRTTQANLRQRSRRGGLDISVLPATILDTIQVVRRLGERYLWIDALCIVQDDRKDKANQIGAMELIYGKSVFTIFAAGGTSVRDPLPGVRSGTREPQQEITKIQGLHLAVPLVRPSEARMRSEWNTRGWTYQELVLSRRRIFFTSRYMHFECVKDVFGEDIVAERINFPWYMHSLSFSGADRVIASGVRLRNQSAMRLLNQGTRLRESGYMTMVEEYTQRRLTFESDIVNAITALINAMTNAYHWAGGDPGKAFRFGMPLIDLELALVWQPATNSPRGRRVLADGSGRPWPSWSWAAWRGAVRYGSAYVMFVGDDPTAPPGIRESLVKQWHIVDDDGNLVPQDTHRTGRTGDGAHWAVYVAPKADIDARQLIGKNASLRPGTLVFRTSSARFNVARADDFIGADTEANYAIYSILSDIPRPSTRVGRIILPCSIRSPTSCEFVVLSRTSGQAGWFDDDIFDEHRVLERLGYEGCMFYVMAVQKMHGEERMERLGVGVIFDRAWLNSTAEQKIVFLG